MNEVIKVVLSLSLSASILGLILLAIKPLIKHRVPKTVQYYIWIIILLRLVIPFSFQDSLMSNLFYSVERSEVLNHENNEINTMPINNNTQSTHFALIDVKKQSYSNDVDFSRYLTNSFNHYIVYVWFLATVIILLIHVFGYVKFLKHLKKGYRQPKEKEKRILSNLLKGRGNMRLMKNEFISTPMVIGIIRPCILIPCRDFNEVQLKSILLHEMTHHKHFDIGIKWLTMIATSIHWFNPLMIFFRKEIANACELACDEAVIKNFNKEEKQAYGDTLISFAEEVKYPLGVIQATMCEEKKSLKERLIAIMKHDKKSKFVIAFSVILTGLMILSALYLGGALKTEDNKISEEKKLSALKGLELYVWKEPELTGNDDIYYTLLNGTNRNKTSKEVFDMDAATSDINVIKKEISDYSSDTYLFIAHELNIDKKTMDKINDEFSGIIKNVFTSTLGVDFDELLQPIIGEDQSVELIEFVENHLETIMSSPKESSSPMDYVKAHDYEYEEIIKYSYGMGEDEVLNYLLSQFEANNAEGLRGHIMMMLCKELLGVRNNVEDESLSPMQWYEKLEIRKEIKLPDFSYDGEDTVEKLVYETEIENNIFGKQQGFVIVAPHIFGSYEEDNKLKVFVTTCSSRYILFDDNVLSDESGSIVPAAITYIKESDGSYSLKEYKQAMDGGYFAKSDGGYFAKSIEEFCTMPVSGKKIKGLADEIMSHYGDYSDIIQLQRKNLIKHLKENNQYGVSLYEKHYNKPSELIPLM